MPEINPTVSIITLSELNNPVKRQRLLYWIKEKKKIQLHAVYRRHTLDSTIQASRVNIKSMEIYIYVMQATAIKELEWLHHQTKLTLKQQKILLEMKKGIL